MKTKLKEIARERREQRKGREKFPRLALVGYTNAGKSTLLNYFTAAGVLVEDRLFACAACTVTSERVARIAAAFRSQIPPVIAPEQLQALRAQGLAVVEMTLAPATRTRIVFAAGTDLMIHHLAGLDLERAERLDVRVLSENDQIKKDFGLMVNLYD